MTQPIPQEYKDEITALAKATANRLAKLGSKAAPRKRQAIIDQAAKGVMEISLRIAFDRLASTVIQGMANDSRKRVGIAKQSRNPKL